jgi:hypothetical protein
MTMRSHADLRAALFEEQPSIALREAAKGVLRSGVSREELLGDFERLRSELRDQHREPDEETVLEVMDYVAGFSSSRMRL